MGVEEREEPRPEEILGRGPEMELLDGARTRARSGRSQVVLIEGAAGVGKTALLRSFLAHAAIHGLHASGDEDEGSITAGVLTQFGVVRPPDVDADPAALGTALIRRLDEHDAAPLLITLDDAHWADVASLKALSFALRRTRDDPILTILTTRPDHDQRIPRGLLTLIDEDGLRIELGGIGLEETRALVAAAGRPTALAQRVFETARGNPLHIQAIVRELKPDDVIADGPLPAPRSFSALVLGTLATCPAPARTMAQAASVLGLKAPLEQVLSLAEVDDPLPMIDHLVQAKIVRTEAGVRPGLVFDHPLVRSAIYHDLGVAARARLHARAAEIADDSRRLRHLAASVVEPDEDLARALELEAQQRVERGAWGEAGDVFLSASRISVDAAARAHRLFLAVECISAAGGSTDALMPAVEACPPSSFRSYTLGQHAFLKGHFERAETLLREALDRSDEIGERSPPMASVLTALANVVAARRSGTEASELLERSIRSERTEWTRVAFDGSALLFYSGMAGRVRDGERLAASWDQDPDLNGAIGGAGLGRGVLALMSGRDLTGAREHIAGLLASAPTRGTGGIDADARFFLAVTDHCLGRWDDALLSCQRVVSDAEDDGSRFRESMARSLMAIILAHRGDRDAARLQIDAALDRNRRDVAEHGDPGNVFGDHAKGWTGYALAHLALLEGDFGTVATITDRFEGSAHDMADTQSSVWDWRDLQLRAGIARDDLAAADRALAALARCAEAGYEAAGVTVARGKALLAAARGLDAEPAFATARERAAAIGMPFLVGSVALDAGSYLRRAGRRTDAAAALEEARAAFEGLQAIPWLERTEREVAACGLTPRKRRDDARDALTPQERTVATLVASGKTNKQVAEELVLSVRTIEFHLTNTYEKLGLRSRAQLIASWRENG